MYGLCVLCDLRDLRDLAQVTNDTLGVCVCVLVCVLRLQKFTIGSVPPRIGGIKCYDTSDDEVVLEVPLVWGSNCTVSVRMCVCVCVRERQLFVHEVAFAHLCGGQTARGVIQTAVRIRVRGEGAWLCPLWRRCTLMSN